MSSRLKYLLVVPLLAPLLAVGWAALQKGGRGLGLPETGQGQLMQARDGPVVVVFGMHSASAWVFGTDGKLRGRLKPSGAPGAVFLPFVHGRRVVFPGGSSGTAIDEVSVGRLPLEGGVSRTLRTRLPAPMAARLVAGRLEVDGPVVVRCGPRLLVRTARGWARVHPRSGDVAPLVDPPSGDCRSLSTPVRRAEVPIPTRGLTEIRVDGQSITLGTPYLPPSYLVALAPARGSYRYVRPPLGAAVWGRALVAGNWVLFVGRSCRMRTLRVSLSDLRVVAGGGARWSVELPLDAPPGCSRQRLPEAWVCTGGIRLALPGGDRTFRLEDGRPAADARECQRMHPLRRGVAPWEGGRSLRHGGVLYRVEGRFAVEARRGGRRLWRHALPGPGWILGVSGRDLLVVTPPDLLTVLDRAEGVPRLARHVPALHDPLEERPSLTQWIGSAGGRGFFLLVRSEAWLIRIRRTALAIYDGEGIELVE